MRKTSIFLSPPALALAICAFAQPVMLAQSSPALRPKKAVSKAAPARKATPHQQFVIDVVKSAVARTISDPQERLRVLATAVDVLAPVDRAQARLYAAEGVRLEGQLIGSGQVPSASLMETGQVDCKTATEFVDQLSPQHVNSAEQALIGAINICPAAATAAQAKLDAGLGQGQQPPRAFMAAAEHAGPKSQWSQSRFEGLMGALPDPQTKGSLKEAPNFAAMYARMAPEVDSTVTKKTGLELLDWLAKLDDAPERNLAIQIVTGSMKQALGKEKYEEALRSDVIAQQTSNITGSNEITHEEEENVSVLQAMQQKGQDQTEAIRGMPPILRAKEAAASGFAEGTSGNKTQAAKYFDIAFPALDEAWQAHPEAKNLAATVEEVSEAAAQVDYVDALKRAEQLATPAEQAIAMLAVARTVLGKSQ